MGQIRGMAERNKRDIEKDLPNVAEAGAWRKAWSIYEAFLKLEREAVPDIAGRERTLSAAAMEEHWNRFLRNRDELIVLIQRGREGRQMQDYIGLVEGDLGPPIDNDQETAGLFDGKRRGWPEVASRVGAALSKLSTMTDSERASVPFVMGLRRLETSMLDLRKRIENIETYLSSNNQPTEKAA